ncbi:MAG: glutathione peroxidase [Halothiobacillus sp. 35-54-62]|jgi:glutathione peroxidase|nr:glutathione peroxidase [Halothiobacillaceae bacterium]OYY32607.1 MAG: glutathione peroxidase [Halothiobacillus sp. 35-54-62]OZA79274.1 MAG: glutathione peroxidase [Halothiobacillus sp. 39-53-45]HQS03096.1 glutathione peroxidase [Halothiobacillus sp.]HQS29468.1 glutathione peroxidase [Halothiobacillus sp.]
MSRRIFLQGVLAATLAPAAPVFAAPSCPLLHFTVRKLAGDERVDLCDMVAGKVVLVVNTASYCGYTPQFKGLEQLYAEYKDQGFVVLGFPSNDFGDQDPKPENQIQDFCALTYDVTFPMFEKMHVRANNASPLFKTLAQAADGDYPTWNFHKYLIGRDGKLIGSFDSPVTPEALSPKIAAALKLG